MNTIRPAGRSVGTARQMAEIIDDHPHRECGMCRFDSIRVVGAVTRDAARWPVPLAHWDLERPRS